jgi:hypothetical protein
MQFVNETIADTFDEVKKMKLTFPAHIILWV